MGQGRREVDGLLAAWHVCHVAGASGADPNELNPFKIPRPVSAAMAELLEWRRKRAHKGLAKDLADQVRRKRG